MIDKTVTIIGYGRVGKALHKSLSNAGFEVSDIYNRSLVTKKLSAKDQNTTFHTSLPDDTSQLSDLNFVTVSDDAIEHVVKRLGNERDHTGRYFIHCSGNLSSEVFSPLKELGANIASLHPLQSITQNHSSFKDIWFDIEGDEDALILLENLISQLEAYSFRVSAEAKPFLHIAAVFASNYVITLFHVIEKISKKSNMDVKQVINALAPLTKNTLQNIQNHSVSKSLTGPISRSDIQTIERHLELLSEQPELLKLYKHLGMHTLDILEDPEKTDNTSLQKLLSNSVSDDGK